MAQAVRPGGEAPRSLADHRSSDLMARWVCGTHTIHVPMLDDRRQKADGGCGAAARRAIEELACGACSLRMIAELIAQ